MPDAQEEGETGSRALPAYALGQACVPGFIWTGLHLPDGGQCSHPSTVPALFHRNQFKDILRQDTFLINSAHYVPSSEVRSFHAILLCAG